MKLQEPDRPQRRSQLSWWHIPYRYHSVEPQEPTRAPAARFAHAETRTFVTRGQFRNKVRYLLSVQLGPQLSPSRPRPQTRVYTVLLIQSKMSPESQPTAMASQGGRICCSMHGGCFVHGSSSSVFVLGSLTIPLRPCRDDAETTALSGTSFPAERRRT